MRTWQEFVAELAQCNVLSSARRLAFEEWGEDIPTTVLFGKLGKALADHVDELDLETRTHIFQIIESGLASSNVALKELVATGLLEAFYLRVSGVSGHWNRTRDYLGPLSTAYLVEWGGINS
ncbi:DUF7674 family protein [Cupriavidus basilensis]|uniref:DUF7674 family protein n=1 Tax=Cupriavidus basilensis TaxID=68895 RepID=UPI0012E02887|nr:hypothetical protein [Cupriavidus basilensis]